jgi:hypothetical protein
MFQVCEAGAGGRRTSNRHYPCWAYDFVLMAAGDVAQAAPETITRDSVANPPRSHESRARLPIGRREAPDGHEVSADGRPLLPHAFEFRR